MNLCTTHFEENKGTGEDTEAATLLDVSERAQTSGVSAKTWRTETPLQKACIRVEHGLACHTQEQIAEAVNVEQRTAGRWIEDFRQFGNLSEMSKVAAEFRDFEQPLFG